MSVDLTRRRRPRPAPPTTGRRRCCPVCAGSAPCVELKTFFREREAVVFIFGLPDPAAGDLRLGLRPAGHRTRRDVRAVLRRRHDRRRPDAHAASRTWRSPSPSSATTARSSGWPARRCRRSAYFVGKIVLVAVVATVQTVLLLAVGVLFYGLDLPTEASRWVTFAWVFLLGVAACTLLGIAITSIVKNGRSGAGGDLADRDRAAVHLRGVLRLRGAAAVDADDRRRSSR